MLIINWYRAKKAEYKIKAMAYGFIAEIIDGKQEIVETGKKIFDSLKGASLDEIKGLLIEKIAELAHEQAIREKENAK